MSRNRQLEKDRLHKEQGYEVNLQAELKARLENSLDERIVGIETVGKMTDRQIAAKVRQHLSG